MQNYVQCFFHFISLLLWYYFCSNSNCNVVEKLTFFLFWYALCEILWHILTIANRLVECVRAIFLRYNFYSCRFMHCLSYEREKRDITKWSPSSMLHAGYNNVERRVNLQCHIKQSHLNSHSKCNKLRLIEYSIFSCAKFILYFCKTKINSSARCINYSVEWRWSIHMKWHKLWIKNERFTGILCDWILNLGEMNSARSIFANAESWLNSYVQK